MLAMTRSVLDKFGCDMPNCNHDHSELVLEPACHLMAGCKVTYHKPDGTLSIACRKCGKPITVVKVAP